MQGCVQYTPLCDASRVYIGTVSHSHGQPAGRVHRSPNGISLIFFIISGTLWEAWHLGGRVQWSKSCDTFVTALTDVSLVFNKV